MIPFGVLFIWVNFLYVMFAYALGTIAYFTAKRYYPNYKNRIALSVFFIILLAPFWDLIIQKGIKTYYETFKMESTIYAYPERDKDGKIESLGRWKSADVETVDYLQNQENLINFKERLSGISKYIECFFYGTFEEIIDKNGKVTIKDNFRQKGDFGYARVYLDETPIRYEKLKDESKYQARYQVIGKEYSGFFYDKTVIEFWDMKKKKLLAKALKMEFYTKTYDQKFRNKYLLWKGANNIAFSLERLYTYNKISSELFFHSKSQNKPKGE